MGQLLMGSLSVGQLLCDQLSWRQFDFDPFLTEIVFLLLDDKL